MSEREIKLSIMDKAEIMAKILFKGKDVEIRHDVNGIKVLSVDKKVVAR